MAASQPLIVIVGATGSGKSALALELAKKFNGEIISADSWQVYRGFDIGTAKPTPEERRAVPHHLVDVADARRGFNAALYKRLAEKAINDIQARGRQPIMAGGTGLYIDSVLYDYGFLPTVANEERARRNQLNLPQLLAEADRAGIDLTYIDKRNKRRVIRALEAGGERPAAGVMRPDTLILGLRVDRENLRQKVAERVDKMLVVGLEAEVEALVGVYGWEVEPMKGIGYREWYEYFAGSQTLAQTRDRIIAGTMNLAKKQRTWFKRNNSIRWLDDPSKAVEITTTFLNKNSIEN